MEKADRIVLEFPIYVGGADRLCSLLQGRYGHAITRTTGPSDGKPCYSIEAREMVVISNELFRQSRCGFVWRYLPLGVLKKGYVINHTDTEVAFSTKPPDHEEAGRYRPQPKQSLTPPFMGMRHEWGTVLRRIVHKVD